MAITKILARKGRLDVGIHYVLNGDKTQEQILTAHLNCEPGRELRQMLETKSQYDKEDGVQYYHMIQSFRPGEVSPELALEIAQTLVEEHLPGYQAVIGVHVDMYKVACSRKEASCIIGSLLVELAPVCEKCGGLPDGVLNLQTEAGLSLTGDADVLITGHSIISGKPVRIKLTDYGFEYYGDHAELARVREKRCVYHGRAVSPTKEN